MEIVRAMGFSQSNALYLCMLFAGLSFCCCCFTSSKINAHFGACVCTCSIPPIAKYNWQSHAFCDYVHRANREEVCPHYANSAVLQSTATATKTHSNFNVCTACLIISQINVEVKYQFCTFTFCLLKVTIEPIRVLLYTDKAGFLAYFSYAQCYALTFMCNTSII